MLINSGFVDNVMFSYHGANGPERGLPCDDATWTYDDRTVLGRVHQNAA